MGFVEFIMAIFLVIFSIYFRRPTGSISGIILVTTLLLVLSIFTFSAAASLHGKFELFSFKNLKTGVELVFLKDIEIKGIRKFTMIGTSNLSDTWIINADERIPPLDENQKFIIPADNTDRIVILS